MGWSRERIDAIQKLWVEGVNPAQIAERFGVTRAAIIAFAQRNRDRFPAKRETRGGGGRGWSDADLATMEKLWREGKSATQIAVRFATSRNAILGVVHRNRDRFPPKRERLGRPSARREQSSKSMPEATSPLPAQRPAEPQRPGWSFVPREAVSRDLSVFRLQGCEPVAFVDLKRGQCRFPLQAFDEKAGPHMSCCGIRTDGLSPYCPAHLSVASGRAA
ncbi:GcrA family cell cycle regulator [Rhizobium cremeum]|uniref:GcrA family cell cycle regulator n=1 Tax=Rhizobium cremeum TaxID=2813827 RepID=UPI0039E0FFF8